MFLWNLHAWEQVTTRIQKFAHDGLDGSFDDDKEVSANDIILCKNEKNKKLWLQAKFQDWSWGKFQFVEPLLLINQNSAVLAWQWWITFVWCDHVKYGDKAC